MKKAILNFALSNATKVFRMKKSTKIALGVTAVATAAVASAVAAKAAQAKKQERSIKSLLVEDTMKKLPFCCAEQVSYEKALEQSSLPYWLPFFARRLGFTEYDDFDDTFVLNPEEVYSDFVIFYIHGYNFWSNPSRLHFKFCKKLADTLGAKLILPVYPKAPAHHVADVHTMLIDRYQYMINNKEIDPQNIIFAGDAAGGGIALSLLQRIKYQALPMPKQAILLSPWLDITNTNPEMEELQKSDPLLKIETLAFQGKEYAGDVNLDSPAVSPIYGDLKGLPPISVFSGTHDILSADAVKLENIAEDGKLDINVYLFVNQVHFFMGLPIPEAREVLEIIAEEVFGTPDENCEYIEGDGEDLPDSEEPADNGAEEAPDGKEAPDSEE